MGAEHGDHGGREAAGDRAEERFTIQDVRRRWGTVADSVAFQRPDDLHPIVLDRQGKPYVQAVPPGLYTGWEKDLAKRKITLPSVLLVDDLLPDSDFRLDWSKAEGAPRVRVAARPVPNSWQDIHLSVAFRGMHVLVYRREALTLAFVPLDWPEPPAWATTTR